MIEFAIESVDFFVIKVRKSVHSDYDFEISGNFFKPDLCYSPVVEIDYSRPKIGLLRFDIWESR